MTETNKEFEVRKLQAGDLFTMIQIISKISDDAKKNILETAKMMQAQDAEENGEDPSTKKAKKGVFDMDKQVIALVVFEAAMKHAETDLKKFLSDVAQVSTKEFEKLPLDAPLDILEQLAEKEDLPAFLKRASGLAKKFSGGK